MQRDAELANKDNAEIKHCSCAEMRGEVGEWLATCVGSPICILLLSWSLLIYQNQSSSVKRKIDLLTVAILIQSLAHQLGLLLYAILTLIRPANHFGGNYDRSIS